MDEVNLDDLKIDHGPRTEKKGTPWFGVVVAFLLGAACIFILMKVSPGLLGDEGEEPGEEALPVNNTSVVPEPGTEEDPAPASFTEGGWIEVPSYHPVVVSALIPGRLEELYVLESSKVRKGEVIALLYQKDYKDELDRAMAEKGVAEAKFQRMKAGFRVQEVEQARADFEGAEAECVLKERIFKRTESLLESGAVSQEDLDRDEAAFLVARGKLETMEQELLLKEEGFRAEDIQAAQAEFEQKKALLELARNKYDYTEIKSPMDGVVLERYVTPGTYIPVGDPRIVSLYDPMDLQVRVDVRQENIGGVFLGQAVEVHTDSEPGRTYQGEVIRIEPLADFKKNTIQVKIKILNPSEKLHPEMIARIKFLRREDDQDHG